MIRVIFATFLVANLTIATVRADITDVAELFPSETLAYAELRNLAETTKIVAGWVRNTPFEDGLQLLHDRKDAIKEPREINGQLSLGLASLLTSSEFLREISRFQGAAVGLTGFTERFEPQMVGVVLFGDSAAGGFLARGLLATSKDLRRVDTIDGTPILQHRGFAPPEFGNDGKPLPFENPKPTEGTYELTYAYRPGLLVIGTSKAVVIDVLQRFAGKAQTPALAKNMHFLQFAVERTKPGVFFYTIPPALIKHLDAARRVGNDVIARDIVAVLIFVVNPEAFPVVAGNLSFTNDEISVTVQATLSLTQPSPLRDLLLKTADPKLQILAPADAAVAISYALPDSQDRARAILAFSDAWAKAMGEIGPLPSEWITEKGQRIGINFRDAVLRRLTAITFIMPMQQELPKGTPRYPILIGHTNSEADAALIADMMPKLVRLLSRTDSPITPAVETIQNIRVLSLSAEAKAGWPAIHYTRTGAYVVLAADRKWVARVAAGNNKNFTNGFPLPDLSGAIVGYMRLGAMLWLSNDSTSSTALTELLDALPPVTVRIGILDNQMLAGLSLNGLQEKLPVLAGKFVTWLEQIGSVINNEDTNRLFPFIHW